MSPIAVPTPGLDPALASALDADLQEVVIVTGTDGRVRSVTPSVERVLGIAAHGLVDRIVAELGAVTAVIATGGLAPIVVPESRTITNHEPDLTLVGLRLIFERNQPN